MSSLEFCALKVETLAFKVWFDDGIVVKKDVAVVSSLREVVLGDAFSCTCDVEDGLSNDFQKNRMVRRMETTFCFTFCKGKVGSARSVWRSASVTGAGTEAWEQKKRV